MKTSTLILAMALTACGKDGSQTAKAPQTQASQTQASQASGKKILASNVVYADSSDPKAMLALQEQGVDTTTKVLAANVIVQNTEAKSDLKSSNVEEALIETNLDVKKIIVGTWTRNRIGAATPPSQATFDVNGTLAGFYGESQYEIHDNVITVKTRVQYPEDEAPVVRPSLGSPGTTPDDTRLGSPGTTPGDTYPGMAPEEPMPGDMVGAMLTESLSEYTFVILKRTETKMQVLNLNGLAVEEWTK